MDQNQSPIILNEGLHLAPDTTDNDKITSGSLHLYLNRNFFIRNYISKLDNKFKGQSLEDLLNEWETDLLLNELQAQQKTVPL